MQNIYLICGVPGSGKTWVCEKVKDRFHYVPNDEYINGNYAEALKTAARKAEKPILADCPFGERLLRESLETSGIKVIPYFIVEAPHIVKTRYEARDKKPIPRAHLTRAISIVNRAVEWQAPMGNAESILLMLSEIK